MHIVLRRTIKTKYGVLHASPTLMHLIKGPLGIVANLNNVLRST